MHAVKTFNRENSLRKSTEAETVRNGFVRVFKARECPEGPEKLGESGKIWEIDACDFTDETDMSVLQN